MPNPPGLAATSSISLLGWSCLLCALIAAAILVHYLVFRPRLMLTTKLRLALGLGVFPGLAAAASTAEGLRVSTQRSFCGSCHVMELHVRDAEDPAGSSLAARHARNPFFGDRNCYVCHADYGMYGTPMTKITGLKHVWKYYTDGYLDETTDQAVERIHLYAPYDNANCMQCHSGTLPKWRQVPEHVSLEGQLRANTVSCASEGCHGVAHPFSKRHRPPDELSRLMDEPLPAPTFGATE
jgi:cytochrome c-type protein NapC